MKLAEYLEAEGLTQQEFSKRTGLSKPTISLLVRRKVAVSEKSARRIIKASGGKIRARDLDRVVRFTAK